MLKSLGRGKQNKFLAIFKTQFENLKKMLAQFFCFNTISIRAMSLATDKVMIKAMLHGAIFLATCLATMTTEKHCKLQRGCHTFAIFPRIT